MTVRRRRRRDARPFGCTRRTEMRSFLVLCLALTACSFRHTLVPKAPVAVSADGVTVSVEAVDMDINQDTVLVVRVDSTSGPVDVDGLAMQVVVDADEPQAIQATLDMTRMSAGPELHVRVTAAIYNAIRTAYAQTLATCDGATSCSAQVHFALPSRPKLDEPTDMRLVLDGAITRAGRPVTLPELRFADRRDVEPFRERTSLRGMANVRFGAGVWLQPGGDGVAPSGMLELDVGAHYGPYGLVGVFALSDPMVVGADVRYTIERGRYAVVPFVGYGFHAAGVNGAGGSGQGTRVGLDIVARPAEKLLGTRTRDFAVGGFVMATQSYWDEPAFAFLTGLSAGFY
jgi:hypothetical protein